MKEEKLMLQKMQDKFSLFLKGLSDNLTKPEQRFLKETCFGILSSQSCIVRRAAQSLGEKIKCKKTQERLIYHLDKENFSNRISENVLSRHSRRLKEDSLILVDPSDIVKKYAKKMEGLSKVRDGNDGKWKQGYEVLDIVGVNRDGDELRLQALYSELCSNTVEIDTLKNKLFDRIVDIIVHSNNKGTFVLDRQFDDRKLIRQFHEHDASYIIRLKKNRNLYFHGERQNVQDVAKSTKLRYHFKYEKGITISANIIPVSVRSNPHQKNHPDLLKVNLVVAKIRSKTKDGSYRSGIFYLLCNINRVLSKKEMTRFVLESYRLRWKIEEVHRQIKTDFGWEDIQLQTFRRLKTMNTLLWLSINFLYLLDKWKYRLVKIFPNFMIDSKLSELNGFVYYKLTSVIRYCFNKIRLYRKITYQYGKSEHLQLMVSWL